MCVQVFMMCIHPNMCSHLACLCEELPTLTIHTGAAISMTYITGQPMVFVGTGQTYSDLKNFNVQSVVQALLN